jgi:hypothetical protein
MNEKLGFVAIDSWIRWNLYCAAAAILKFPPPKFIAADENCRYICEALRSRSSGND